METKASLTKYFLLGQLSRNEMSGYELITQIEKITGKRPSTSQIYPVLKQMQSAGYVTLKTRNLGKKTIKFYTMTKSGRTLFEDVSSRFEAMIRAFLRERIKTCAHCGCEIYSGAYKKSGVYFCCASCADSYKK